MKLKIYSFLAVCFAAIFTANAQIAGTYNGTMNVEVLFPAPDVVQIPNQDIIITEEAGGLVKLSILNFSFMGLELGNLDVAGIGTATYDGKIVGLEKEGFSAGPVVEDLGGLGTLIKLNSASVSNTGALTLDLSVYLDVLDLLSLEEANVANVTFTGNRAVGINSPKAEKIAIYSNLVANEIVIEGVKNVGYSVFNPSGILVKQGKLTTANINVSDLNAGLYILNINGITTTFIKR